MLIVDRDDGRRVIAIATAGRRSIGRDVQDPNTVALPQASLGSITTLVSMADALALRSSPWRW
jgi:hypothetical protein